MADIAGVWHWPPQAMDEMALSELMMWRAKAAERNAPPSTSGKRRPR